MQEIVERIFEYQSSMYRARVEVNLYADSPNAYAEPMKSVIDIEYDLEFERKTWGLQGAPDVRFDQFVSVDFEWYPSRGVKQAKTVEVDLSSVKIEWVPGDGFYPLVLRVYLDADGNLKHSEVIFVYWQPGV